MKFSEFIERFQAIDETLFNDIKIEKYVPLARKCMAAKKVQEHINYEINAELESVIYMTEFEVYRFFALLETYTDVAIEKEEKTAANYDLCQSVGVERVLRYEIGGYECERFDNIMEKMTRMEDTMILRQIFSSVDTTTAVDAGNDIVDMINNNKEFIDQLYAMVMPSK